MSRMVWAKPFRSGLTEETAVEFDRLLRRHIPAFYSCAYRWTGSADAAEDLVQELLIRLYPRLDELRALDQPKPWAMRVMYRIFVDGLRREQSSPVQFGFDNARGGDGEDDLEPVDESEEPGQCAEREL